MSPRDPVHPGRVHSSVPLPGILRPLNLDHSVVELGAGIDVPECLQPVPGDVDRVGTVRVEARGGVRMDVTFENC